MPNIAEIQSNPKFQKLDYSQKRLALETIFNGNEKWSGLDTNQKESVFTKVLGTNREREYGELKQGVSPQREKAQDVFTEYVAPGIETGASIAGSVAGAPFGPAGSGIGGALTYGGAKQGTRAIENLLRGTDNGGLSAKNLVMTPLSDIAEGAAGELLPTLVTKSIERLIAPGAKKLGTKAIRTSSGKISKVPTQGKVNLLNLGKSKGIDLLPADVTGSKTTALVESFLDKLPGSSDVMADFRLKAQLEPLLDNLENLKSKDATKESIDEVGQKIWGQVNDFLRKETTFNDDTLNMVRDQLQDILGTKKPTSAVAEEAQEALVTQFKTAKKGVRDKFDAVSEALPTEPLGTPELKKASAEVLEEIEGLPAQSSVLKEVANWVESGGQELPKDLLEQIKSLPEDGRAEVLKAMGGVQGKTPKQLKGYVETLNSLIKKEDALLGQGGGAKEFTKEGALFTKLKGAARTDLESLAESAPDTGKLLKEAKTAHGEFADTFKTNDIRNLLKSKPKDFIDKIISKDNVKGVIEARKAIGPAGFEKVKQGLTNKLLGVGKNDVFDPKHLRRVLATYEDDVLNEVYGKDAVNGFKQIADGGLKLLEAKPGASFLKTISKEYPDTVVDALIGTEGTKVSSKALIRNVSVIKKAIPKKEFNALGDKLFEKIMEVDGHTKLVKPVQFAKTIEKYGDRLKAFYPGQKVEELKTLAALSRDLYKAEQIAGNPSGTGQINIMWGLLNMARSLPGAKTTEKITTGALLFVPKKLAEFYTSPSGRKYLTEGYKIPKTETEMIKTGLKIATLANIDLDELKKEKK